MALDENDFFMDIYSIRSDGKKVFPYKGERGNKKGLFSVNFTNDTNNFEGFTEEQLIQAIENGKFRGHGTIRMLPLDYNLGEDRSAYSPEYYKSKKVKLISSNEYISLPPVHNKENSETTSDAKKSTHSKENPVDEITYRAIKTRRGQPEFRKALLLVYAQQCPITGCKVESVLEAAHIIPHTEETNYTISNGILLRADIHTLYDLNLIGIDGCGMVVVSKSLQESEYWKFNGKHIEEDISESMSSNLKRRFVEYEINS